MKKIIKPAQPEECEYIDDFSGKPFEPHISPPVEITVECGYGSNHDGDTYRFHCDDAFLEKLLDFLQKNINAGAIEDNL